MIIEQGLHVLSKSNVEWAPFIRRSFTQVPVNGTKVIALSEKDN